MSGSGGIFSWFNHGEKNVSNRESVEMSTQDKSPAPEDNEVRENESQDQNQDQEVKPADVVELEDDDESGVPKREGWVRQIQFILTCLGYAVGLGNVWRFPYLVYKYGGGTFFVPYFIMLIFLGAPVFLLEISIGQFSAQGPVTCWTFAKLFRGVGFAGVWVTYLIATYYQVIMAWSLYYLFQSFSTELPWSKCSEPWMTPKCRNLKFICEESTDHHIEMCVPCGHKLLNKTTCLDKHTPDTTQPEIDISNSNTAENSSYHFKFNVERVAYHTNASVDITLSGYEYFKYHVTGSKDLDDSEVGGVMWHLFFCLLISWMFIALCLSQSIKSVGRASYVFALAPYVLLTILLCNGVWRDGAVDGILFYITPKPEKLANMEVWVEAAIQIFFSLSATLGGLIALASYNKFHTNLLRDSAIVVIGNSMTSIYAGFVVFSYIGIISKEQHVKIDDFAEKGPSLVFGVYPMAITLMAVPQLWSVTFFLMLLALGLNTNMVNAETVITSMKDIWPRLRRYKVTMAVGMCSVFFIQGIIMTFESGMKPFEIFDKYSSGWNSLLVAFFEFVAVAYAYGASRFLDDIGCMVGKDCTLFKIPWKYLRIYYFYTWIAISPVMAIVLTIMKIYDFEIDKSKSIWLNVFGLVLTMTSVGSIFGYMIYAIATTPGTIKERLKTLTTPLPEWGPPHKCDRVLVAEYTPGFVVDLGQSSSELNVQDCVPMPDLELSDIQVGEKSASEYTQSRATGVGTPQVPSNYLPSHTSL